MEKLNNKFEGITLDRDAMEELPVTKQDEITHKIYMRVKTYCCNQIDFSNVFNCIILVMKELNKHGSLYGFNKRKMCLAIMLLLLADFGIPEVVMVFTADAVTKLIENIYENDYHRKKGCCIIL